MCLLHANACRTFVRARAFVSFGVGEGALSEGKINTRVRVSATDRFSPLHEGTELRTRIVCGPGLKHDAVVANSSLLYRCPFPSLIALVIKVTSVGLQSGLVGYRFIYKILTASRRWSDAIPIDRTCRRDNNVVANKSTLKEKTLPPNRTRSIYAYRYYHLF